MEPQELRKVGLKVTHPRVQILEILANASPRHMTAEDIYRELKERDEDIGLATVYRVLTQFEAAGLVLKHNFEGGTAVWNKYYKPLNACNYGVSGDKTENILWRLGEGKNMDGFNPRVCVLLIGINNLLQGSTPQNTAAGITAIVRELRKNHPDMKILLLGVFPCRPKPEDPIRQKVKDTNAAIAGLHDGKHIFYADIGSVFLEKDGTVSKEILRDYLHLSEKGYERWAEAMRPHLDPLLKK